ncbi:MAG: hypothetical protein N3A38_11780, partial [Planctomycetota bacterium]|nr:hypothetical protein [Planctomycetota bacterium]
MRKTSVCGAFAILAASPILIGRAIAAEKDLSLQGTTIIENEVSRKRDWAAGSYIAHPSKDVQLLLNTRPKDGDLREAKQARCQGRHGDMQPVALSPDEREICVGGEAAYPSPPE